jgi:hypothetical protein
MKFVATEAATTNVHAARHFVATASAAAAFIATPNPRAKRGAKFVQRAFARGPCARLLAKRHHFRWLSNHPTSLLAMSR